MQATDPQSRKVEDIVRAQAPHVLAALVRRYGHFEMAEEATQDALLDALQKWGTQAPDNPRGWLLRVAQRRLIDSLRSEYARADREHRYASTNHSPVQELEPVPDDDSLDLLFLCCHPDISPALAIPLTLRAVCGLTTAEIANGFFVQPSTMGQRISRAKSKLRNISLTLPNNVHERRERLDSVLNVLSIMFNEGYISSAGESFDRPDIACEALRLARMLHKLLQAEAEIEGLLGLMLLHTARRPARLIDGLPVPIEEQDRSLWTTELVHEGLHCVEQALTRGPLGRFQLMAAITAVHCEATDPAQTDWHQILALHDLLLLVDISPMAQLSRIVALSRVHGPRYALAELDEFCRSPIRESTHRYEAIRGNLLADVGDLKGAEAAFRTAAAMTGSASERRYLLTKAEKVRASGE